MLLSIVHSARRGGCRCRGQRTSQAACRRSETPVPGGARVVRCSGGAVLGLESPSYGEGPQAITGEPGTEVPGWAVGCRHVTSSTFRFPPRLRVAPNSPQSSPAAQRQHHRSQAKTRATPFVSLRVLPPLIRVHSWFKPHTCISFAASRLRVRPTATPRSGKLQAASRRGQNSGRKAPATFIRAHSCPFVVQHHPLRFLRGFAASRETNCLQLVWQLTAQCSGWKARATVCHSRLESPSSSL